MALWRLRSSKQFRKQTPINSYQKIRVKEAGLETRRPAPQRSTIVISLSRLLRWMMPESKSIAPPMRSVARELEENFPSNEY